MLFDIDRQKENILIERIKQGERSAFDELTAVYQKKGFAIAYNILGNPEDARDVLQEAFIKVYLNIKSFKKDSGFYTWFYRILVNCSLDFIRKRKKTYLLFNFSAMEDETKEKEVPDMRYVPAKTMMNEELALELDKCISGLPEKQRICFTLKHQNGLANAEIARVLNCSLSTVKVHLFRAVNKLQDKLSFVFLGYRKV